LCGATTTIEEEKLLKLTLPFITVRNSHPILPDEPSSASSEMVQECYELIKEAGEAPTSPLVAHI
jgi:hypothetical protein